MVAVIMQRASRNGMARFRKEFLPTRPTWPYGLETRIRIRQTLRKVQDLPKGFTFVPRSPPGPVRARRIWRKSWISRSRMQTLCNSAVEAPPWLARSRTHCLSQYNLEWFSRLPIHYLLLSASCTLHSRALEPPFLGGQQ